MTTERFRLDGVTAAESHHQRVVDGVDFPLILSPVSTAPLDILDWLRRHQKEVDDLLRQHKAVFFRGFESLSEVGDFHNAIEALDYATMDYVGGAAVRTQLTPRVFTANESPSSESIPFHHEMAQTPHPPTHLYFFCEIPAQTGGETPILVSHEVYDRLQELHPHVLNDIEQTGVQYIRVLPEDDDPTSAIGRGWKSTFLCQTKEEAEQALQKLGSSWEWLPNGDLRTITAVLPAIRTDSGTNRSGQKTFYNSIVAAYTGWNDARNDGRRAVRLADGRELDEHFMADAVKVMNDVAVAMPWVKGDLLLVDNRTVMHSRRPFEGPRRILASLARDSLR